MKLLPEPPPPIPHQTLDARCAAENWDFESPHYSRVSLGSSTPEMPASHRFAYAIEFTHATAPLKAWREDTADDWRVIILFAAAGYGFARHLARCIARARPGFPYHITSSTLPLGVSIILGARVPVVIC